jgi:soluble P-type ATPase
MEIAIPGRERLELSHLVMDYNGTLAVDGRLIEGTGEALKRLSTLLDLHVLTADTFGIAEEGLSGIPCRLSILPEFDQQAAKRDYVKKLGGERTAAVGNGRNDRLMLKEAALGIALILEEGACAETLFSADVVCTSILSALSLFENPLRLKATLRS